MSKKKKSNIEYIQQGELSYRIGNLCGDWWICSLLERKGSPTVHMKYEWGSTRNEVLSKKGIDSAGQGVLDLGL